MAADPPILQRPTRIRYVVLTLTFVVAVLLYLHRICLSFVERYIKEDLRITDDEMGWVLSSFFVAYALGQLPAGWLADRHGARIMLAIYLALWSACVGVLAFAYSLASLIILRSGVGIFQAGGYPASAGLIRKWMPFARRGFASGIVSLGGRLGGALAFLLSGFLIVAFVPVSTSSLLGPDDLLKTAPILAPVTSPQKDQADVRLLLTRRIIEHLPADLPLPEERARDAATSLDVGARLRDSINAALKQPDLLAGIPIDKLELEPEGRRLAESATPLTPEEVQRRNRLVLEAAFPDAIRKVYGAGWRPLMILYGVIGLVAAGLFWWFFRDSPRQHRACNAAEIALIEGKDRPFDPKAAPAALPFTSLLTSTSLWLSSAIQFLTNLSWAFLITWLPRYLTEEHQVPVKSRGLMAGLPILVGMVGMFAGGWLTDAVSVRLGPRWGRSLPLALSRFVVALAFFLAVIANTPWPVTLAFCLVAFATDLGTPSLWGFSLDVGGKHVGSVLGWSNMYGNFGAALSPVLLQAILRRSDWDTVFITCAVTMVIAGVLSLFLDATRPVVPEERLAV